CLVEHLKELKPGGPVVLILGVNGRGGATPGEDRPEEKNQYDREREPEEETNPAASVAPSEVDEVRPDPLCGSHLVHRGLLSSLCHPGAHELHEDVFEAVVADRHIAPVHS